MIYRFRELIWTWLIVISCSSLFYFCIFYPGRLGIFSNPLFWIISISNIVLISIILISERKNHNDKKKKERPGLSLIYS